MKWQSVQCISTLILSIVLITIFGENDELSWFRIIVVICLFVTIAAIISLATLAVFFNRKDEKKIESLTEQLNKYKSEKIEANAKETELQSTKEELEVANNKIKIRDYQLQVFYQFIKSQWAGKEEKCPFNDMKYDDIKKDFDKFVESLNGSDCLKKETTENN